MVEPKSFYLQKPSSMKSIYDNKKVIPATLNEEVKTAIDDFVDDIIYDCSKKVGWGGANGWRYEEEKKKFAKLWSEQYNDILAGEWFSDKEFMDEVRQNLFEKMI